ncbi:DNA internalization-related competence protein ComEC/Rec2 [Shouchella clausii]|uniref:DNA internalization-related competence protein ComEC/Rec2 n=1 Tax=Shouchella clausii TaxID=79880 RepID=UPI00226C7356|nr:DNA internalization-related competence protein ComEC/Rec2 [Shouchella clausii]MCY1103391.1 DNA internalization-related competence protein ComEC/Rec2 [Shouchella clausii]
MNRLCISLLTASAAVVFVLSSDVGVAGALLIGAIALLPAAWQSGRLATVAAFVLPLLLFASVATGHKKSNVSMLSGEETTFIVEVKETPRLDGNRLRMVVETTAGERLQLASRLQAESEQRLGKLLPGDHCHVNGKLSEPDPPRNRYAFDYSRYLYEQRIHWLLEAESGSFVCKRMDRLSLLTHLQAFRAQLLHEAVAAFPKEAGGIVLALTLGERFYVEEDVIEAYSTLGIIHLLAISGLHVGLVTGAAFFICIRIGLTRERAALFMLILLPIFAILAGAAPPVVRASAMAFVFFLFALRKWRVHPLFGFATIYFLYLLFDPYKLFQLGFQLSFLVSFALIFSAKTIQTANGGYLRQMCTVTTIAQLAGLPLIFFHFYEWSPLSLLLNLVYIPLVSFVVLPFSFLSLFSFAWLPEQVNWFIVLLESLLTFVHPAILKLSGSTFQLVLGKPPIWLVVAMYVALAFAFVHWQEQKWPLRFAFLPFVACLIVGALAPYVQSKAVVTMIDVGQGDSFLIELPYRKGVYMIDTGGVAVYCEEEDWQQRKNTFDPGSDVIAPFLKAKGISKIDMLVLTHGDYDHIGGATGLLNEINVEQVIYPEGPIEKETEIELLENIDASPTNLHFTKANEVLAENWYVLHPPEGEHVKGNDSSVVLFAKIEGVTFLFTGDLEEAGEQRLIRSYPGMQADVLKVGHHGSLSSTTEPFISQVAPRYAFISAGAQNRFGHPHPEVVERLERANIVVWRTDIHGMVELTLSNGEIEAVETMLKP